MNTLLFILIVLLAAFCVRMHFKIASLTRQYDVDMNNLHDQIESLKRRIGSTYRKVEESEHKTKS